MAGMPYPGPRDAMPSPLYCSSTYGEFRNVNGNEIGIGIGIGM